MPADIKSVIAKVKALRELATKNTSTEEMHSAMKIADALMQQHRLSLAEVESAGDVQAEAFVEKSILKCGKRSAWRETIIWALCQHYGGAWYWGSLGRSAYDGKGQVSYILVAKESDCEIIDYMFNYLESEISRLCKQNTKGQGLATAMSWLLGAAEGVAEQFREIREAEKLEREQFAKLEGGNQSAAIVLLANRQLEARAHMEAKHGFATRSKAEKSRAKKMIGNIGRTSDYEARQEGYQAGKSIQINKGIGQGKKGGGLLGE